jgi:hypothetical protein
MYSRFALIFLIIATSVLADHGLDFVSIQDGTIPAPGSFIAFNNSNFSLSGEQEYEIEPGLTFGLNSWLSIGSGFNLTDEGEGWEYVSTSPFLTAALFRSETVPWFRVSVFAGYEIPQEGFEQPTFTFTPPPELAEPITAGSSRRTRTTTITRSAKRNQSRAPESSGGSNRSQKHGGGDEPEASSNNTQTTTTGVTITAGSSAADIRRAEAARQRALREARRNAFAAFRRDQPFSGIDRHGEEGFFGRLVIDFDLTPADRLLLNFINFTPRRGEPVWGYAVGYRHSFSHVLATSLEATGDLDGRGSHEALVAVHWAPVDHIVLKLGFGHGLTSNSPDANLYAGAVWRF